MAEEKLIELTRSRQWTAVDASQSGPAAEDKAAFSVVTYNILSEHLLKSSSYFHKISEGSWSRSVRHRLLLAELDALDADVVCLQEVDGDYWEAELRAALELRGYRAACSWRPGPRAEGVVTCARVSAFSFEAADARRLSDFVDEMIDACEADSETRERLHGYADAPQRCLIARLRHRRLGLALAVGNAHVSYQRPPKPDLRAAQAVAMATRTLASGGAALLCGDFNSTPESFAFAAVATGGADWPPLREVGADWPLLPALRPALGAAGFLESAYSPRDSPCTLNLTNNCGCVDFIFYDSQQLRAVAVLPVASWRILREKDSVPDGVLPSDHLSLAAKFRFCG